MCCRNRLSVLLLPRFLYIVIVFVRVVTRHMRVSYITVGVFINPLNSCTLDSLTILRLNQLAAIVDHSEVEGCSIIHRVRRTLVKTFHVIQTWYFFEIHAFSLNYEIILSIGLITQLNTVRSIVNFARSQLVHILVAH